MHKTTPLFAAVAGLALGACTVDHGDQQEGELASHTATFLELSFEGQVIAPSTDSPTQRKKAVVSQLFYLSGELDKTHGGHGRFGFVELSDVTVTPHSEGLERVHYRAKLPIAWPKRSPVPETYRVLAPLHVDTEGLDAFNAKYAGSCGKAKYGNDNLWYDFKPLATRCEITEGDAIDTLAKVSPSPHVTSRKRPEYERFWADDAFKVVIVHGTDESSGLDPDDAGVREYLDLQARLKASHPEGQESKGETNYDIKDEWRFATTIPRFDEGQGALEVTMLLTGSLKYIGEDFDTRYAELSADADVVIYAGHSGLSKNIKALAARGTVTKEHYQVFFIDGCSTYTYLDDSMARQRIEVNGADVDPEGTKYLDLILNAQPAPWYAGSRNMFNVVSKLSGTQLYSYLDILDGISTAGMPLVAGEEDNPSIVD